MSASLVGSEMCIRDSPVHAQMNRRGRGGAVSTKLDRPLPFLSSPDAVSYTHLTLPTICSV
eukprot:8325445-Alexandrium_andersonii.AAC.1